LLSNTRIEELVQTIESDVAEQRKTVSLGPVVINLREIVDLFLMRIALQLCGYLRAVGLIV
jgi:hypothetical protein